MARLTAVILTSLVSISAAQIFSFSSTCTKLVLSSKIEVDVPLSLDYEGTQLEYWSTKCSILRPACVISPKNAQEVSEVVKILRGNKDTFAIKSGGHNPNAYFSSVSGGPLINTRRMNEVTLDAAAKTVRVGPGNRWGDVSKALDGTGFATVGGRLGDVGVGGYLPLGGISFLSSQYGWGMSSILEMEVVLANGTITTASKTQNKDIFDVLHGGGNQFGIITSFLLEAHPISQQIYGGTLTVGGDQQEAVLAALGKFARDYENHPKAAIIVTSVRVSFLTELWIVFTFFDGTDPGSVFADFDAIPRISDDRKLRTYNDLLQANSATILKGVVNTISSEFSPLPDAANNNKVLSSYVSLFRDTAKSLSSVVSLIPTMALQPVPRSLSRAAKERGGDLYDIDDSQDHLIVEHTFTYLTLGIDDERVDNAVTKLIKDQRNLVQQYAADGTLPQAQYPVFANDGYFRQDFWGRMSPAKRDLAKSVKSKVDPDDFFTQRTGGWKL